MGRRYHYLRTREGRLILAFLMIMTAFALMMAGIGSSQMWLCKAALLLLAGALLYSPLKTRVLTKREKGKSE